MVFNDNKIYSTTIKIMTTKTTTTKTIKAIKTIPTMKTWFEDHLQHIAYIPDDLQKHLQTKPISQNDPWWLAEAIVISALDDQTLENDVLELMQIMEDGVQQDSFLHHVFDIVERLMDIMTQSFRNPSLKNAFTVDNAFITLFYVVQFTLSCALGEDRGKSEVLDVLKQYEKILLSLASMASKLLLNNDVYEFVSDSLDTCISRGKMLC